MNDSWRTGFKRVDYKAQYSRYDGYSYSDSEGNTYSNLTEQEAIKKHDRWGIPPFWIRDEEEESND